MPRTLNDIISNLSPYGTYQTALNNLNNLVNTATTSIPASFVTNVIQEGVQPVLTTEQRYLQQDSAINDVSGTKHYLETIVSEVFNNEPILRYFYSQLYNTRFQPDVNGYCLIFLIPPHLSGYMQDPKVSATGLFYDISKMSVFLAVDITPPTVSLEFDETTGVSASVVYASEIRLSKQLSVTYIEDRDLSVFSAHKIWMDYIRDVTRGVVDPDPTYMNDDYVEIDYVSTIYCVRFRPSLGDGLYNNILYIGKAVGVFPISLPDKEVLGSRQTNEITLVPISYMCSEYRQYVFSEDANPKHNHFWVLEDFKADVETMYH